MHSDGVLYEVVSPGDPDTAKRQYPGACTNPEWRETKVESTSTGWTPEHVRHCFTCFSNTNGGNGCDYKEQTEWSTSYTISFGLEASAAGDVLNQITGNAGFTLGYEWSETNSVSMEAGCGYNPGEFGLFIVSEMIGIAETSSRLCKSSCINERCGGWEAGRIEYPLKDSNHLPLTNTRCDNAASQEDCRALVGQQI